MLSYYNRKFVLVLCCCQILVKSMWVVADALDEIRLGLLSPELRQSLDLQFKGIKGATWARCHFRPFTKIHALKRKVLEKWALMHQGMI